MVFFTFVLPPECGERVSLCITVLMAMTIFQELTSEKLPPSSDTFFLIGELCIKGTLIISWETNYNSVLARNLSFNLKSHKRNTKIAVATFGVKFLDIINKTKIEDCRSNL